MTDHDAIASQIVRITHHIDHKRWAELRSLFAAELDVDYTALKGGSPQHQRADELVAGWQHDLASVTTQHLLGPIDVTISGDTASAACHVRAHHFAPGKPGGDDWIVMGHYLFRLARTDGWTITAMKLEVFRQTGNSKLLA